MNTAVENLKTWLETCPQLSSLTVDSAACNAPGLYPMGLETKWEKKNVLGGKTVRYCLRFALRAVFPDSRSAKATWLMQVQQWLATHTPGLGSDESVQVTGAGFRGEKGGLTEYNISAAAEYTCRQ